VPQPARLRYGAPGAWADIGQKIVGARSGAAREVQPEAQQLQQTNLPRHIGRIPGRAGQCVDQGAGCLVKTGMGLTLRHRHSNKAARRLQCGEAQRHIHQGRRTVRFRLDREIAQMLRQSGAPAGDNAIARLNPPALAPPRRLHQPGMCAIGRGQQGRHHAGLPVRPRRQNNRRFAPFNGHKRNLTLFGDKTAIFYSQLN